MTEAEGAADGPDGGEDDGQAAPASGTGKEADESSLEEDEWGEEELQEGNGAYSSAFQCPEGTMLWYGKCLPKSSLSLDDESRDMAGGCSGIPVRGRPPAGLLGSVLLATVLVGRSLFRKSRIRP